jgi:(p)ppGpp synthase/HD superfamily hydrolase
MSTIQRAEKIAAAAHADTFDKFGAPYMHHVHRVSLAGLTEEEKIVGLLHDVVEDTEWTFEALENEGFSKQVIDALKCVTKTSEDEDYELFIQRVARNPLAIRVKLNDLADNMDIRRIPELGPKDFERLTKYHKAYQYLKSLI